MVHTTGVGGSDRSPAVEIGEAAAETSGRDGAARSAETVRYDDVALQLLSTRPVVDSHLMPGHGDGADDMAADLRDERVWAIVVSVLPPRAVDTIRQLNVVSDGPESTLAMVHRSAIDAETWILSIDPAETTAVLEATIIHEYAHMLTMVPSQLSASAADRLDCPGVSIQIGCALDGSALAQWHDEFWSDVEEPAEVDPDRFVSSYASSSVHEDLAESFMTWVMEPDAPTSPQIVARFDFFAARPEFVEARAAIRDGSAG